MRGNSLIKYNVIEIGGQNTDKHISMWNRIYYSLTQFNPSGHFGASSGPSDTNPASGNGTLYQLIVRIWIKYREIFQRQHVCLQRRFSRFKFKQLMDLIIATPQPLIPH